MVPTPPNLFGISTAKAHRHLPKNSKLKVAIQATFVNGTTKTLQALVDTGAEVSLINPPLVDPTLFEPSPNPVRLGVANSHSLPGGQRQVFMTLTFDATDPDTTAKRIVSLPCMAYDADVVCDMILSYHWMAESNVVPHPRRHGMFINFTNDSVWVPGVVDPKYRDISVLEDLPIQVLPTGQTPP